MSHPPEDKRPLPEGWIRQFDSNNNAWFYVDTRATPPRSIWVHPLDDPEYQRAHKEKDAAPAYAGYSAPAGPPPGHSEQGQSSKPANEKEKKSQETQKEKRGAFGKLKDKLIGTKEEREAERQAELARREEDRLRREQMLRERQQRIMQMRQSAPAGYYQQGPGGYYQQAPGGYYQQQPGGYYQQQQQQQQGRSGFGGGGMGMGLPILGGLAGGLLLGSALDAGDGGWGGDDGGGDDGGGGDFGGGDF